MKNKWIALNEAEWRLVLHALNELRTGLMRNRSITAEELKALGVVNPYTDLVETYWAYGNEGAMCAAFLQSPYFAQKDEPHKKKCQRSDYLPNTAKTACATLRSTAYEDTVRYRRARNEAR